MDLIGQIKNNRAKQRQKKPIKIDVFNQISGIVRQYGLKESFLDIFDTLEDQFSAENLNLLRVRVKTPVVKPIFSLVAKEEYDLIMSIIHKAGTPYLEFAHSPEEILLCKSLYRLNPAISAEKLSRYHFETLFLHERVKRNRMETNRK